MSDTKKGKAVQSVIHVQDPASPESAFCGDAYAVPVVCPDCVERMRADGSLHVLSPKSADRALCGRIVRGAQAVKSAGYLSMRRYDDLIADQDTAVEVCKFCVANLDRMRVSRGSSSSGGADPAALADRKRSR